MQNSNLIKIIQILKEKNLKISKLKTKTLLGFNCKKVRAFIELLNSGFINQSNINYAIGEIEKITDWDDIDRIALDRLHEATVGDKELNNKVLKLIFTWYKAFALYDVYMNFEYLDDLLIGDNLFFTRDGIMDVLLNPSFFEDDILINILEYYDNLIAEVSESVYDETLKSINEYLLDKNIIKFAKEEKEKRNYSYTNIVGLEISESLTPNIIDNMHNMISGLIQNKKLNVAIEDLLYKVAGTTSIYESVENIQNLYTILMNANYNEEDFSYIIDIINHRNLEKDNNQLAELVCDIYENQPQKQDADMIFKKVVKTMANSEVEVLDVNQIRILISSLPEFENLAEPYQTNILNYVESVITKGSSVDIQTAAQLIEKMREHSYRAYNLLPYVPASQDIEKATTITKIFMKPRILETVIDFPFKALTIKICVLSNLPKSGIDLLSNRNFIYIPSFIEFDNVVMIVKEKHLQEGFDEQLFYSILSTFDFENDDLNLYIQNLLTYDNSQLKEIYEMRRKNKGAVENVTDCIYQALTSTNDSDYEQLMKLLKSADSDEWIDESTKMVYPTSKQKKLK